MENYVVYRHISPSKKVYIGITCKKPENRWNYGKGYKTSTKFYNAIQKYGWDNIKHEILFTELNEISAKLIEEDLIFYYKQQNISYNITNGGEGSKGRIVSFETKQKMSEAKKGKTSNRKGCHLTEETKTKLRIINLGKHHSEETKKKCSEANKGKKFSDETRKKISEAKKGHQVSEETRYKISKNCNGNRGMCWKINPDTGKRIYYKKTA